MAALDFPTSPVVGQAFSATGKTWKWDGAAWLGVTAATGYGVVTSGAISGGSASSANALITITTIGQPPQPAPSNNPGFTGVIGMFGGQIGRTYPLASGVIDVRKSNYFTKTIAGGTTTFTITGLPLIGSAPVNPLYSFVLDVQYSSGSYTWPGGTRWSGTSTLTSGKNLVYFSSADGGQTWQAYIRVFV